MHFGPIYNLFHFLKEEIQKAILNVCRYMSLKENKYIRYFGGHDKKVVTLAMNPADDTFLSGSMDKTIRLWDLRSNHCQVCSLLTRHSNT